MSLGILLLFTKFLSKYRISFVLSFLFYGVFLELLVWKEGVFDSAFFVYLLSLAMLQCSFIGGLSLPTRVKRSVDTKRFSAVMLLSLFSATYVAFIAEFGSISSYLAMNRSLVYGIRQGGSPLFDVLLFFTFLWAAKTFRFYRGLSWSLVLIALFVFPLLIGDRRLTLILIFPFVLYKLSTTGYMWKALFFILMLSIFVVVGVSRGSSEAFLNPNLIPTSPNVENSTGSEDS